LPLFSESAFYTSLLIGKISKRDDTFFERFPARRNRTVHSGLIFRIVCTVGYLFRLKEKIRRIGGCKGRLSRVYLTSPVSLALTPSSSYLPRTDSIHRLCPVYVPFNPASLALTPPSSYLPRTDSICVQSYVPGTNSFLFLSPSYRFHLCSVLCP
jgi:hypothetical protein